MLTGFLFRGTAQADSVQSLFVLKQGVLEQDEIWSGKILIPGDVVVPKEHTLTIAEGTWLVYNDVDLKNLGQFEDEPELIIRGQLIKEGDSKSGVMLLSISDPQVQDYIWQSISPNVVTVAPEEADLIPLQKQWRGFKHRYAILWTIISGIWLIL